MSKSLSQRGLSGGLLRYPPRRPFSSDAVRFAYRQKVTGAGGYAEHVSQGSGQVLRQKLHVFRARMLVTEGFRGLPQQFGRRPELHRFDVVARQGM